MPADAREQIRQLPSGKWQLRYYDRKGTRHTGGVFPSKSAARAHYRDVVEPGLNGKAVARRDLTYTDLVEVFLERHAIVAKPSTIYELRWRLKQSATVFGTTRLAELENMSDEIAAWRTTLPERSGYGIMQAFRQCCEAGVRYGYMTRNPAKLAGPNPMPKPRGVRVYTSGRVRGDRRGTGTRRGGRCDVRGSDRTQTVGVGVGRAPRRRQTRRVLLVRGTKTTPVTTRGSAHQDGARRARPGAATAGLPVCVQHIAPFPRHRGAWPVRRPQLPEAALGTGDRSRRDRDPRAALRPPVDVRVQRARRRDHCVRVGPDHGHVGVDDRELLRHVDRHRQRRDPHATRRVWGMSGARNQH